MAGIALLIRSTGWSSWSSRKSCLGSLPAGLSSKSTTLSLTISLILWFPRRTPQTVLELSFLNTLLVVPTFKMELNLEIASGIVHHIWRCTGPQECILPRSNNMGLPSISCLCGRKGFSIRSCWLACRWPPGPSPRSSPTSIFCCDRFYTFLDGFLLLVPS